MLSLGVALVIALVPLTLVAALWPNYRIAPLTAVIVLLTPGAQQLGPVNSAFYRIVEITLGSFVGRRFTAVGFRRWVGVMCPDIRWTPLFVRSIMRAGKS